MNKNNAMHAIVVEAVSLAIGLEHPELLTLGAALLAKFLAVSQRGREPCGVPCAVLKLDLPS